MLSIIIVNYKTSFEILRCLKSIVHHEHKYKEYEFIIIDNNSSDPGLDEIKKTFSFVKIIYASKNGGFAYGNNIGINNSTGDYIFLLNPDTYIEDNSIQKLYHRITNDKNIHIIGPKLLNADGSNQSYYLPKSYLTLWKLICEQLYLYRIFKNIRTFNSYFRTYMNYETETPVEQVSGAALMFRREIINRIGLLDENYFMYFEESDFCLQAVMNGFKLLYYPESKIIHTQAAGMLSERAIRDFVISFKYFFNKNYTPFAYYPALLIYLTGSLLRLIKSTILNDKKQKSYFSFLKYLIK